MPRRPPRSMAEEDEDTFRALLARGRTRAATGHVPADEDFDMPDEDDEWVEPRGW